MAGRRAGAADDVPEPDLAGAGGAMAGPAGGAPGSGAGWLPGPSRRQPRRLSVRPGRGCRPRLRQHSARSASSTPAVSSTAANLSRDARPAAIRSASGGRCPSPRASLRQWCNVASEIPPRGPHRPSCRCAAAAACAAPRPFLLRHISQHSLVRPLLESQTARGTTTRGDIGRSIPVRHLHSAGSAPSGCSSAKAASPNRRPELFAACRIAGGTFSFLRHLSAIRSPERECRYFRQTFRVEERVR